jgi:AcrR family transcriptional regulator
MSTHSDKGSAELTRRGAATRARIVDAAAELVQCQGAAGTSVDEVLAAAKVSKSQLYHYFADKDALILAVVERQAERVLAGSEPLLAGLDDMAGLRDWRDRVVAANGETLAAGGCPLGSLVGELAEQSRFRAALAAGFARWTEYFVRGLERMQAAGRLRPDADPQRLATGLMVALQGGLLLAQTQRDIAPLAIALEMATARVESFAA